MHFYRAALSDGIDLLMGFAFDGDKRDVEAKVCRDDRAHRGFVGGEFWFFEYHCAINIDDAEAFGGDGRCGFTKKLARVLRSVTWISVWKELADVRQVGGAEECVCDGVEEGITIGMCDGTAVVWKRNTAQHKGLASTMGREWFEAVEVVAVANTQAVQR